MPNTSNTKKMSQMRMSLAQLTIRSSLLARRLSWMLPRLALYVPAAIASAIIFTLWILFYNFVWLSGQTAERIPEVSVLDPRVDSIGSTLVGASTCAPDSPESGCGPPNLDSNEISPSEVLRRLAAEGQRRLKEYATHLEADAVRPLPVSAALAEPIPLPMPNPFRRAN
jgi:hypothetical protein